MHAAKASENAAFAEFELNVPELTSGVRPGFRLAGKLVDVEWTGGTNGPLKVIEALALKICSDPTLASAYTATVENQNKVRVSALNPFKAGFIEVSDLRAIRPLDSVKASGVTLFELKVAVGDLAFSVAADSLSYSESHFLSGSAVVQQRFASGMAGRNIPIEVQALSSRLEQSGKLSQRLLVGGPVPELQATTPGSSGSTALFVVDPGLAVNDLVALRLGGEQLEVWRNPGDSIASVLERLVATVRSTASLANRYGVNGSGGTLKVSTLENRAWAASELEAVTNVELKNPISAPISELELEAFAGTDPGTGKATRIPLTVDSPGAFVFKEAVELPVSASSTTQNVGLRVRRKDAGWSDTLFRRVVPFGSGGIQIQPAKPLSSAAVVELLPRLGSGDSTLRVQVLGETIEVRLSPKEVLEVQAEQAIALLLERLAQAVNESPKVGKVWRALFANGRVRMTTLLPKSLGDGEVVPETGLEVRVSDRGQAAEEQTGVAKIEVTEILGPDVENDHRPVLAVAVPAGVPFMTVVEVKMTSLELSGGTNRFGVRAVGAGGEVGNWTVGKLVVTRPLGADGLVLPALALPGLGQSSSNALQAAAAAAPSDETASIRRAGVVMAAPLDVTVSIPPWTGRYSSKAVSAAGSVYRLGVVAKGGGPFSYQWYRNSTLLPGAREDGLVLGVGGTGQAGVYRVLVTLGDQTTGSSSPESQAPRNPSDKVITFTRQPLDVALLRGGAASVAVGIQAPGFGEGSTRFQLYQRVAGGFRQVGSGGVVASAGVFHVPLRGLADGKYVIKVTGEAPDGAVVGANSQEFQLTSKSGSEVEGVYEAMLLDSGNLLGDSARYRGIVSVTVSKTGAVSGRVCYNEAESFVGGGSSASRTYIPVVRRFAGVLTQVGASGKLVCIPKLGIGAQAQRQQMRIEIDYLQDQPALTATITDQISLSEKGVYVSVSERCFGVPSELPATNSGLIGRYTVLSDQADGPAAAQILMQVLASGRVVWTTRMRGGTGSGSATVQTGMTDTPSCVFYESRMTNSQGLLATNSLLGRVRFEPRADSSWDACVGLSSERSALEQHSTFVGKAGAQAAGGAVYTFDRAKHWSGVSLIPFESSDGCLWLGGSASSLAPFVLSGTPMHLSIRLSQSPGQTLLNSYAVSISPSGVAKATGLPGSRGVPPVLSLRLDRTRGELKGSFLQEGIRHSLRGALMRSDVNLRQIGKGWIEDVSSTYREASWSLESVR